MNIKDILNQMRHEGYSLMDQIQFEAAWNATEQGGTSTITTEQVDRATKLVLEDKSILWKKNTLREMERTILLGIDERGEREIYEIIARVLRDMLKDKGILEVDDRDLEGNKVGTP